MTAEGYALLGQQFRGRREQLRIEIKTAARQLFIRPQYLEAIESGKLEALPGGVYLRGYLRQYAQFLQLDPEAVLEQYDRVTYPGGRKRLALPEPTHHEHAPGLYMLLLSVILLGVGLLGWFSLDKGSEEEAIPRVMPVPRDLAHRYLAPTPTERVQHLCLLMQEGYPLCEMRMPRPFAGATEMDPLIFGRSEQGENQNSHEPKTE